MKQPHQTWTHNIQDADQEYGHISTMTSRLLQHGISRKRSASREPPEMQAEAMNLGTQRLIRALIRSPTTWQTGKDAARCMVEASRFVVD